MKRCIICGKEAKYECLKQGMYVRVPVCEQHCKELEASEYECKEIKGEEKK